jgi:hypothetical protein
LSRAWLVGNGPKNAVAAEPFEDAGADIEEASPIRYRPRLNRQCLQGVTANFETQNFPKNAPKKTMGRLPNNCPAKGVTRSGIKKESRVMRHALLAAFVLISGATVAADSAKNFIDQCADTFERLTVPSIGFCAGTLSMLEAVGQYLAPELRFCSGSQTPFQLASTLRRYIRNHPDAVGEDRIETIAKAFRERWPCP